MAISEKLYPPTINGTLPAFYENNADGGTVITIPFSMNRAVNEEEIAGFVLKIKTVQTGTTLGIFTVDENINEAIENEQISFVIKDNNNNNNNEENILNKIHIGQFLKIQLAYYKQGENNAPEIGYYSTVGIIKYTAKPKVYLKSFSENYDNQLTLFLSDYTGIYENEDASETLYSYNFSLYDTDKNLIETSDWLLHDIKNKNKDFYSFYTQLISNKEYFLQYTIRTINGLEESSSLYKCMDLDIYSNISINLISENIFDEGYIKTTFELEDSLTINENNPAILKICRAEDMDNFSSWVPMQIKTFYSNEDICNWSFKDFSIQQGVIYQYCLKIQNENGLWAIINTSNQIFADFEDMFLWDGEKQIKIRFNPKVASFKATRLEQKTDVIGNKYPIIFRNSMVNYKEFSISGLISYQMDDYNLFNIKEKNNQTIPDFTPMDLVGENIYKERQFKLNLLNWLSDGNIKLFKSPAEGNYFVRLINISLSPEDKLNRMIHSFFCTAYEVEEFNYQNLIKLKFIEEIDITSILENNITNIVQEEIELTDNYYDSIKNIKEIINNNFQDNIVAVILIFYSKPYHHLITQSEPGLYFDDTSNQIIQGEGKKEYIYIIDDEDTLRDKRLSILESPKYNINYILKNENKKIVLKNDDILNFPIKYKIPISKLNLYEKFNFSYPIRARIGYIKLQQNNTNEGE